MIFVAISAYGNELELGYSDNNSLTRGYLTAIHKSDKIKAKIKFISQDLIVSSALKLEYQDYINKYYGLNASLDLNDNPRIDFRRFSTKIGLDYQHHIDDYTLLKANFGIDAFKINNDAADFSFFYQVGPEITLRNFIIKGQYFHSAQVDEKEFSLSYQYKRMTVGLGYSETTYQNKSDYQFTTFIKLVDLFKLSEKR